MTAPLGKDLLGLEQLTAEQITLILDTAVPLKEISEQFSFKIPGEAAGNPASMMSTPRRES